MMMDMRALARVLLVVIELLRLLVPVLTELAKQKDNTP